jgi:hypothetical protein
MVAQEAAELQVVDHQDLVFLDKALMEELVVNLVTEAAEAAELVQLEELTLLVQVEVTQELEEMVYPHL